MIIEIKMALGVVFSLGVIVFTVINLRKNNMYVNVLTITTGVIATILFLGQLVSLVN